MTARVHLGTACAVALLLSACGSEAGRPVGFQLPADPADYRPLDGYGPMEIPADNPLTAEAAELGWKLFFDQRLSGDGRRSCYGCHLNDKGQSDGRSTSLGAFDKVLVRNSPTLWNIGFHSSFYWDGRKTRLADQASAAWTGSNMGAGGNLQEVIAGINAIPEYQEAFQKVYGEDASKENIPRALASYMRTIIGGTSNFDRWQAGDESAVSDAAKRGHVAYQKARCDNCHAGRLFTDQLFHNVGIGWNAETQEFADVGRFKVSGEEKDRGAFKTPTLRDVGESGPYFHDGSAATLMEAVGVMLQGGHENPHLDTTNLKKADLGPQEVLDLVEFLKSLTEAAVLEQPELPGL